MFQKLSSHLGMCLVFWNNKLLSFFLMTRHNCPPLSVTAEQPFVSGQCMYMEQNWVLTQATHSQKSTLGVGVT